MSQFKSTFQRLFNKHPFLMNSTIYGCLYVGAEFSQQYINKRVLANTSKNNNNRDNGKNLEAIDYATIGRYAVMGTTIYAPTLYTWYKWIDKRFPGTARPIVLKKLVLDQFLLTPFLLVSFYVGMAVMECADNKFKELQEKFVPTFARSCCFWLPAQYLNFFMVPPRFRVIYVGACGFIWVNILCSLKRKKIEA